MSASGMVLDVCNKKQIENPSDETIRTELANLDATNGDAFVILAVTKMTYVQVSGDKRIGFDLEYQEGSASAHFRATDDHLSLDRVVDALIAYRNGDPTWRDGFTFEKITW